jgi:hypothetical protein
MKRFIRLSLANLMFFIFKLSIIAQGIVVESSQTPDLEEKINTALEELSAILRLSQL